MKRQDIEALKGMTTPLDTPKRYLVRDLFLFSCYTGISYGDMCRLTQDDLETAEDGRHTCATVALAHSISIESVAKMLGHSRTDPRGTKYFIVYLLGNYQ